MTQKDPSELKITYNQATGVISLEAYNEGFFNYGLDITKEVMELAVEKLFNDMNCPVNGGQITLTRKKDVRGDLVRVIGEIKNK